MVLMVDDDDDALEIYKMLVERTPFSDNFITKNDGIEALNFLQECHDHNKNHFPRYIVLDLNMPGFGGVEFIRKYEEQFHAHFPQTEILILTSSVREKDNEEVQEYESVSHFISKPLPKKKLISLIEKSTS